LKEKIKGKKKLGRRRKELLDDFKGTAVYWNLKEKALDLAPKTTRFGRGYRAETDYVMKMKTQDLMIKMEPTLTIDTGRGIIHGLSSVRGSESFL
jgi:hypothetical protein